MLKVLGPQVQIVRTGLDLPSSFSLIQIGHIGTHDLRLCSSSPIHPFLPLPLPPRSLDRHLLSASCEPGALVKKVARKAA